MQETSQDLFKKYSLSFNLLSDYIRATYDPEIMEHLDFAAVRDSLSDGQTASKLWVVEALSQFLEVNHKRVGVFGGWVGILCRMLYDFNGVKSVDNIEIDGSLKKINQLTMGEHLDTFKFIHSDMFDFDYQQRQYDVYINTSGEHIKCIKDWIEKIPSGKIVIIQSNDYYQHPQHINCVASEQELEAKAIEAKNVKDIIYRGRLSLPVYNRFMIICLT